VTIASLSSLGDWLSLLALCAADRGRDQRQVLSGLYVAHSTFGGHVILPIGAERAVVDTVRG
jgi:hypothetical protein